MSSVEKALCVTGQVITKIKTKTQAQSYLTFTGSSTDVTGCSDRI